jgi:hypothetical protein
MNRIIFYDFLISLKIFNTADESYIRSELKVVIYISTVLIEQVVAQLVEALR